VVWPEKQSISASVLFILPLLCILLHTHLQTRLLVVVLRYHVRTESNTGRKNLNSGLDFFLLSFVLCSKDRSLKERRRALWESDIDEASSVMFPCELSVIVFSPLSVKERHHGVFAKSFGDFCRSPYHFCWFNSYNPSLCVRLELRIQTSYSAINLPLREIVSCHFAGV